MRVVEEPLSDEALEVDAAAEGFLLDRLERGAEAEGVDGVLVVEPFVQGFEHDGEASRESAGVLLPQGELHGVDGGFDRVGRDSLVGELGELREDQGFDLGDLVGVDAFQADGPGAHAQRILKAEAGEILAQAGIDQGFAKRRGWRAREDVGKYGEAEAGLLVAVRGEGPVDGGPCLRFVAFVG